MKHLFVINPAAGGKKSRFRETESEIQLLSESLDAPYEIYMTEGPMDACRKIIRDAETAETLRVYACGGDGTLNECVNGAALRKNVAITQYPCGTGNDFIRMFGEGDAARFSDLRALTGGTVRPLDLIDCGGRYGLNICSVGVDARIGTDVHKYSGVPLIGGATGYIVSLIVNLIKGVTQDCRITIDDTEIEGKISLACACNGRFYGGGFNPAPDAIPDDGLLDCLVIRGVSRLEFIKLVGLFAKGRIDELGDVATFKRANCMEVAAESEFVVNIDGEAIITDKVCFRLIPKGVNFIFPQETSFFKSNA